MDYVLKVDNIDLQYRSVQSLSIKSIAKVLTGKPLDRQLKSFTALKDVSFTIEKGKVYGVIGSNGAGKSTLLRILSGVMSPTKGKIHRNYNTINLLALGVGFSKELTGKENIYLNSMLLGFSKKQVEKVIDDIIEYSELGVFVDRKLQTYSSGMVSRLGFSIAIHLKPEVLLIDEILSVGDASFKKKSYDSIQKLINDKNTTVVMVTHDINTVKNLCDEAIWLNKSELVMCGKTENVLSLYSQFMEKKLDISQVKKASSVEISDDSMNINLTAYNLNMHNPEIKKLMDTNYDYTSNYNLGKSNLKITKRVLKNGDFYLYFEGENCKNESVAIELDKVINSFSFEDKYRKPPFDNRYGESKVTGFHSYIDLDIGSAIMTKLYYFKERFQKYEQDSSYLLELDEEVGNSISIENNRITVKLKSFKDQYCFTLLMSKDKLFKSEKNLSDYIEFYYDSVYNNSVWCSYFLRKDGTYTKLPYSIEPFTRDGYGFSLQHSSKKHLVQLYQETKEHFYHDMITNAILQTYLYQRNDNHVFYTPYTSTWLKKDTGITAPYIDTRLNETFAHMLYDFLPQSEFNNKLDPYKNYAEFLYSQWQIKEQTYSAGEGVFFPDYFKQNLKSKTHASLNHQLGTAMLMYKSFKNYKLDKYFKIYELILKFVENTEENWINKETGDLFYGLNEVDGQFEYYGNDYIYVTLLDLLLFQEGYFEFYYKLNPTIERLTKVKLDYLKTTDYDIFAENPRNAPGERIDSRDQAIKLIGKLYGDKLN